MRLYTIGFTKKSAEEFFSLLGQSGVQCLVDIRLHPYGQLAGFTKKDDLAYFLKRLNGCSYRHMLQLAPSEELLKAYHKGLPWAEYEATFQALLAARGMPEKLDRALFNDQVCCLLCSEAFPEHCHRRLVAESMRRAWGDVEIIHL